MPRNGHFGPSEGFSHQCLRRPTCASSATRLFPPWRMDFASRSDGATSHVCSGCDRSFAGPGPLNFHQRSCRKTKRRLQGVLAKAKELWEARKRSKRHTLNEPRMVDGRTPDPPTQIPNSPLTTAIPTTAASGSNATAFSMAETKSPSLPAVSTHVQAVSTQSDTVCGGAQAAGADH